MSRGHVVSGPCPRSKEEDCGDLLVIPQLIDQALAGWAECHHSMHAVVARSHWSRFERFTIALFSTTAAPVSVAAKHFLTQRRPITGKVSACQDNSPHQNEAPLSKNEIGGKSTLAPSQYLPLG
jgi:hypothetical protein